MFQGTPDDIMEDGSKVFARIHPDDIDGVISSIHKSALELSPWKHEYRIRHFDGALLTLYGDALPEREADGSVLWHGFITDITGNKAINEKLHVVEKSYHDLVSNLQVGILVQGPESEILICNNRASELLGYSENQLLGKTSLDSDWDVIHEDGTPYPGATHPVSLSIATRKPVHNAIMGVSKPCSKQRVWLLVDADPQLNFDGSVKEVICTFVDISELRWAKEALQRSEKALNQAQEIGNMGSFIFDVKANLITTTSQLDRILGFGAGQVKDPQAWNTLIYPEDRQIMESLVADCLEHGGHFERDYRIFRLNDGELRWLHGIYRSKKGPEGKVTFLSGVNIDITDRKKMEEVVLAGERRYRDIFEKNLAIKLMIDPLSGEILTANQAAANFYGYSVDQLERMNINEINILPPEQVKAEMVLASKESCNYFNFCHRLASGEIRDVEVYSGPIESGGRTLLYSIIFDITVQKHSEAEILLKNEALNQVNAEKDKFFSIIAHDLRSPFNGFLGLTELLADNLHKMTAEDIQQSALLMKSSARNLYDLLGNLLEWSRMKRGLLEFVPKPFLLFPKIGECLTLALNSANKKEITIIYKVPDDLKVLADENMFMGIIRNLMTNAIKFTPRCGSIVILARPVSDNMVEFSIKDSGIGMSKAMIDNLFRLDVNSGRKGTEGEPSTGLGLIICKDFIEKHGGEMWVESQVGIGTTFWFTLPAIPVHPDKLLKAVPGSLN